MFWATSKWISTSFPVLLFAWLPGDLLFLKANEMRVNPTHAFLVNFRVCGLNLTLQRRRYFYRCSVAVMLPPEMIQKQNHLPFENMKHADYDRTDTTGWSTTEPRGERSMMTYYYFIFSEWSLIYISRSLFGQVPPVIGVQSPWLCVPTCIDILQQGSLLSQYFSNDRSFHAMESVFRNPWNFCLWNPESWAMESGIHLKESGILLTKTGIKNLKSEINGVKSRIQDCLGLLLHGAWQRGRVKALLEAMLKTELLPTKNKTFTQSLHRQSNVIDCTF